MTIGATEASRSFAWYTAEQSEQVLQYARKSGDAFPDVYTEISATSDGITSSREYNHRAEISDLDENTEYVYRVGNPSTGFSAPVTFRTAAFHGNYNFLLFGDPQVGASGNLASDQAGWVNTVDVAMEKFPQTEMLFSAGDQVNKAPSEDEYDAFLAPTQLKSVPLVPTNGNHDVGSLAYQQHFTVPNFDPTSGAATKEGTSGGDYWFMYKDVLYINLNSNSRDYAAHNAFMEKVVAEHGAEAKWKVVAFHHSIYSVAAHVDDDDIIERRATMPEKLSELGIDLVLMGHDHSYTRTYLLNGAGEKSQPQEVSGQADVTAGEGEVLYVTANSASGSKYYDVKAPKADYASVINQEYLRNYTNVEVKNCSIALTTYRAEDRINSVVDSVTLRKDPECVEPGGADGAADQASSRQSSLSSLSSSSNPLDLLVAVVLSLLGGIGIGLSLGVFTPIADQLRHLIGR